MKISKKVKQVVMLMEINTLETMVKEEIYCAKIKKRACKMQTIL